MFFVSSPGDSDKLQHVWTTDIGNTATADMAEVYPLAWATAGVESSRVHPSCLTVMSLASAPGLLLCQVCGWKEFQQGGAWPVGDASQWINAVRPSSSGQFWEAACGLLRRSQWNHSPQQQSQNHTLILDFSLYPSHISCNITLVSWNHLPDEYLQKRS